MRNENFNQNEEFVTREEVIERRGSMNINLKGSNFSKYASVEELKIKSGVNKLSPVDLSKVENMEFKIQESMADGIANPEEHQDNIDTIKSSVSSVSKLIIGDETWDISLPKLLSVYLANVESVTGSLRFHANADTREFKGGGFMLRDEGAKAKKEVNFAVGISGISQSTMTLLDEYRRLISMVSSIIRGHSYMDLGSMGKSTYLNNNSYILAKSVVYNDIELDLADKQSELDKIIRFIPIGDKSLDISLYGSYSAYEGYERRPNDFGDPFENIGGLKNITRSVTDRGTILSRKMNPIITPAKASYAGNRGEQVDQIIQDIQKIQIAVANALAIEEIQYMNSEYKPTEKLSMDISSLVNDLREINTELNNHKFSNEYKVEDQLGVKGEDKITHTNNVNSELINRAKQQEVNHNLRILEAEKQSRQ